MDRKPLLDYADAEFENVDLDFSDRHRCDNFWRRHKKVIFRISILALEIILIIWFINEYNRSMESLAASECSDVLADCENIPFNDTVIPPFYDYLQDFIVVPKYGISECLIPKLMSTISTGMMCFLDDSEKFTKSGRTIATSAYETRLCVDNEKKSYLKMKKALKHYKNETTNILLVRDPYDRFLSGFVEKCVKHEKYDYCLGCGRDIRCFLRKEFRRLKRISMLFPVYTVPDTHFAPQTWFCDMRNSLQKSTLVRYGNTEETRRQMIGQFEKVFRSKNVTEEEIREVDKELSKGRFHDSTTGSKDRKEFEKLVREDEVIRRAIKRIYYWDFVILGFDM